MQWPVAGGGALDKAYAPNETLLSPATVPNLKQKWAFRTRGMVMTTPTVDGDYVYATDFKGYVYKINRLDGKKVWEKNVSSFTGLRNSISRNSPAITATALIFGDLMSENVVAIDKNNGNLLWKKSLKLDGNGNGHISNSPVVYNNVVYAGVASFEEGTVLFQGKKGPVFRGSVWALNANTGDELWHKMTVPAGYTGGGVWSSTMAVDAARGSLYITTGDNYTVPGAVADCLNALGRKQDELDPAALAKQLHCLADDDYVDAVVAYDLNNGNVKWAQRLQGADAWNAFCLFDSKKKCAFKGVDWDFGAGPNFIDATIGGQHKQRVGAGQKNGIYWALDPDTGNVVWSKVAGPPDLLGGIERGTATDDKRVYVAESNTASKSFTLVDNTTWNHGVWAALDAATGNIVWQTKPPTHTQKNGKTVSATLSGGVSTANGVVYSGTLSGDLVALDANDGTVLWHFTGAGTVLDAPSIVDGTLYWGADKLYAFTVP
jgi:polyvinyl alcohol dehydrogenase (cytochrome)